MGCEGCQDTAALTLFTGGCDKNLTPAKEAPQSDAVGVLPCSARWPCIGVGG